MKNPLALAAAAVVAAATLALAGCAADAQPTPTTGQSSSASADDFLQTHDLAGLDARQIIDRLDATPLAERPTDLIASVRPDELLLKGADGAEFTLPMPADETYVSFAPYREQTHDCYFHSLTTCTGELRNAEVGVTVTDNATGEVVHEAEATTFDNGFLGLWLPRGLDGTLTVTADGLTATAPIATTGAEDATCLTTLQLA